MVKTGVFKKIAALTAAIATIGVFAVSASADVGVSTTTQYTGDKVNVIANVSGLSGAVEVTYYATNGDDVVYVDQTTATDAGAATFDYVTDATDLKSAVKVGYTAATAAVGTDVTGYTISGEGITSLNVPTENVNGTHVLAYALADGKKVVGVTSSNGTVSAYSYANGELTVTLTDATKADVVLTVAVENEVVPEAPEYKHINSAGIVSTGLKDAVEGEDNEAAHAADGDRKVSVLGKLLNVGDNFGVIVSDTAIVEADDLDAAPTENAYQAKEKNALGQFAVQLIDDATEGEKWFEAGKTYYTGLYFFNPVTEKYVVVAGGEITIQ